MKFTSAPVRSESSVSVRFANICAVPDGEYRAESFAMYIQYPSTVPSINGTLLEMRLDVSGAPPLSRSK